MNNSQIELSVIVTAHAEGRLLQPTLNSIAAAIDAASEKQISSELIVVLDNASVATHEIAKKWATELHRNFEIRLEQSAAGETGAARNFGVSVARGEFVALIDGDDIVSSNYLVNSMQRIESFPGVCVVHPAVVISFGARPVYWEVSESTDLDVSYIELVEHNLWPSSLVARREVLNSLPYQRLHPEHGFGPEDWFWNIVSISNGIEHLTASETAFFYRVRATGGVNNKHAFSILPFFKLEELEHAFPPRQLRDDTGAIAVVGGKRAVQGAARRMRKVSGWLTAWLHPNIRLRIVHAIAPTYQRALGIKLADRKLKPDRLTASMKEILQEATAHEPAITWTAHAIEEIPAWEPKYSNYTVLLKKALSELRGSEAVVAVPWVGIGGADLVSLNYASALNDAPEFQGKVAMLATFDPSRTIPVLVPTGIRLVQIPASWRMLPPNAQSRLLAQVFVMLKPQVIISVNCFDVTNSLAQYGRQLGETSRIFLSLFAWDKIGYGFPTNPITDDAQRDWLSHVGGVLTDNNQTASLIKTRLGLNATEVIVHSQPAAESATELRTDQAAFTDTEFNAKSPFRIIWPHRIDREKRPDILLEIARECARRNMPVAFEIWGQRVLNTQDHDLLPELKAAGITYRGPYQGGLPSIDTSQYHSLLLTSESEGLPLVLVQSLLAGIPVISSGVGGVPEIIIDGETGLVVNNFEDIDGYVSAIEILMTNRELTRQLITRGHEFATEKHSWEQFADSVHREIVSIPSEATS